MDTQSTHTQRARKNHYAAGSSRGTRSATTLLAQVADLERGQRIKARRVELHLTQPALVDLIEDLAKQLPAEHALHPEKAGKAPVTLRGLQTWEQGGGVAWEKAKLLAGALQTDARWLINGVPEGAPTPDLFPPATPSFPVEALEGALAEVLAEIKDQLAQQTQVLDEIKGYAVKVERMLEEQRDLKTETDELLPLMRKVAEGLPQAKPAASAGTPRRKQPAKT